MENELVPIQKMIYEIRGKKVMLDRDLAFLYEVPIHRLNETVKRNIKRFPEDFMFRLTKEEWDILRSQFAIANKNIVKVRFNPFVFTEHGIAMLSGLLNSDIAINVNIQIMRTFIKLRQYIISQNDTNEQIIELRKLLMLHIENTDIKLSEHDKTIKQILYALNSLIEQPPKTKKIGFSTD